MLAFLKHIINKLIFNSILNNNLMKYYNIEM
jgi:hypothetical protein